MMLSRTVRRACLLVIGIFALYAHGEAGYGPPPGYGHVGDIKPKFMIISMFAPEADVWYNIPDFNLLARNISIPGLSPLFPHVHCTKSGEICQVTVGESEINAASTISAVVLSPQFDLTKTYFMVAGIAGINPEHGSLADVTFARYAIQVALQYEFDAREIPDNFTTGYFPLGAFSPSEYPQNIYGTEVFELSVPLQKRAINLAKRAHLNDSADAASYRSKYTTYPTALHGPKVRPCDVATSDVYFSGKLLGDAFTNFTTLITNGTGVYCTTAEEDNATLEALVRAAMAKLVDFSRVIVMRTASDFDRPFAREPDTTNLLYAEQGGFEPSIQNIYLAGREVIKGVTGQWGSVFEKGVMPDNYIGDIFGSLGGTPDFGLPSEFLSNQDITKRSVRRGRKTKRFVPEA